jgi:hypothetical protein
MTKQQPKKTEIKAAAPAVKNPRSDTIPRTRKRWGGYDKEMMAHTASAGRHDRGLNSSFFEVVSTSNRTGEVIRTRHQTWAKAFKASIDRSAHHGNISIWDHTPKPKTIGEIMASIVGDAVAA